MQLLIVVLAVLVKLEIEIETEEYIYVDAVSDIRLEIPPLDQRYPQPRLLTDSIGVSKLNC